MRTEYPGFYLWRNKHRDPRRSLREPLPLRLWPQDPSRETPPVAPDPMDYGRVAGGGEARF